MTKRLLYKVQVDSNERMAVGPHTFLVIGASGSRACEKALAKYPRKKYPDDSMFITSCVLVEGELIE